jgi:hypothetical protein
MVLKESVIYHDVKKYIIECLHIIMLTRYEQIHRK